MDDRGERIYAVVRRTRPIVLASARVVQEQVSRYGWTVGARAVAETLAEEGAATVPQIARRLDLARQNVQRQVEELARLGHVERYTNPTHRRSVLIYLTSRGVAAFETLRADELGQLASLAPEYTDEQLRIAIGVLDALHRDIALRTKADTTPMRSEVTHESQP